MGREPTASIGLGVAPRRGGSGQALGVEGGCGGPKTEERGEGHSVLWMKVAGERVLGRRQWVTSDHGEWVALRRLMGEPNHGSGDGDGGGGDGGAEDERSGNGNGNGSVHEGASEDGDGSGRAAGARPCRRGPWGRSCGKTGWRRRRQSGACRPDGESHEQTSEKGAECVEEWKKSWKAGGMDRARGEVSRDEEEEGGCCGPCRGSGEESIRCCSLDTVLSCYA